MPHFTRLKQIKRKDNLIIVLIIDYIDHYIHFKEPITEKPFSYKYTTLREYKYITLKKIILKLFFSQQ
jgi:hypothetical protein